MHDNFDFVIQIIGKQHSGKSNIAHMIEEVLHNNNVKVKNEDIAFENNDFRDVKNKRALITIYNCEYDHRISN
jgi:uridine kinase